MTYLRKFGAFIAGLALFLGLVTIASADTNSNSYFNYDYCNTNNSYQYNQYPYGQGYSYNTNCPHGSLFVYVQINQPNIYNNANRKPSDFTVSVAGQNVSNPSFPGSSAGTEVKLIGSYSVSVAQFQGYYPTYSTGCTGSVAPNTQATCVITENPTNGYPNPYPYPQPYPYPPQYPQPPIYQPYSPPTVVVSPTYVPSLPNTGFEPLLSGPYAGASLAFGGVALIVIALLSFAYVRKVIAYIGS